MYKKCACGAVMVCLLFAGVAVAADEEMITVAGAFKAGEFLGTIGNYFEYVDRNADDSDSGWSTAYITLKYETAEWQHLKLGARFFAHGELYSHHDNGTTDAYEADIETNVTLPELYAQYGFFDTSSVAVGRWNHKKMSHIDDAQSEGGYVSFKQIDKLELIAGVMRRFAEIDYDDGEDFGRDNDAQDVRSDDTYGADAGSVLMFFEARYQPIKSVRLNPFFMYHNDYANVLGLDAYLDTVCEKYELTYGGHVLYQHVNADIAGSADADIFVIQPFVKKGPVKLTLSYSMFDDGDALNHPGWLADSYNIVDQDNAKNNAGADVYEGILKYSWEKVWVSYACAFADYDTSGSEGTGYEDHEFQVGWNITDSLDINARYFIVNFDDIADKNYNKVETRARFRF